MPNWCNNTLRINGDRQHINQLPWKDGGLLFDPLLPMPGNLSPERLYQWAIANWGVKWDCSVEIVDCSDDYLELQFDTPWTAPINGFHTVAQLFPNLTFDLRSSESGCDWQGSFFWENGELVEEVNGTYYQQSPRQCPDCGHDYYPEIDLDGDITYSECSECGWCC